MPKISDVRKKAVHEFLSSPFLKKNRCYTLKDAFLDVDLILSYVLKTTRSHLIAMVDDEISAEILPELERLFKLRFDGLTLAYIIGEKEFYGLLFYVNEDVLIPKADTELLVEKGIQAITELENDVCNKSKKQKELNILDIFTGSGCVAISIASFFLSSHHNYTLIDISEKALNVAKRNAKKLIGNLGNFSFLQHDALKPFPLTNAKKYDVILANPPYIPHKDVLNLLSDGRSEPSLALDGGEDGLCFYQVLARHSFASLNDDGILLSEIGDGQAEFVSSIFQNEGFQYCICYEDLSRERRVVEARKR